MTKQQIIAPIIALAIMGTLLLNTPKVYADDFSNEKNNNSINGLSQYLSNKFGLNNSQVQSVISEYQQQQNNLIDSFSLTEEQKNILDQLVSENKITEYQKKQIIDELILIRVRYNPQTLKGLSVEEKNSKMTAIRDEIIAWAKLNNIDSSFAEI